MNDIVKIAAVAVAAALCCTVIRKQTPELALSLALTAGVIIFWMIASSFKYVTTFMNNLADTAGMSTAVFLPVLKVIGIAMVTKTSEELCRDANEGGLASFVDLAGTVCALVVTIPLAKAVLNTVSDLM